MKSPVDWREARRLRALALYRAGWPQKTIAEALGVTKGAVSQWIKKARDLPPDKQAEALRLRKSTGRPPVIPASKRAELVALIDRGAEAFDFIGEVWTAARVRAVAWRELGIRAGRSTIKTFLHEEGFSAQKPQVIATQKNEKAVAGFRGGWVNLKKGRSAPAQP